MDIEKLNALTARANELSQGIEIIKNRPTIKVTPFEVTYGNNRDSQNTKLPGYFSGFSEMIFRMIECELSLQLASHAGEIAELCRQDKEQEK